MKKLMKLATFAFLMSLAGGVMADVNWKDYSHEAFSKAQKSGKTILLGFHKKGCGTCAAQDKVLGDAGINKVDNLVHLRVERKDDSLKAVYEKYGLNKKQWAAMVLLKDGKEVARLNPGTSDASKLKAFAAQAK